MRSECEQHRLHTAMQFICACSAFIHSCVICPWTVLLVGHQSSMWYTRSTIHDIGTQSTYECSTVAADITPFTQHHITIKQATDHVILATACISTCDLSDAIWTEGEGIQCSSFSMKNMGSSYVPSTGTSKDDMWHLMAVCLDTTCTTTLHASSSPASALQHVPR